MITKNRLLQKIKKQELVFNRSLLLNFLLIFCAILKRQNA